VTTEACLAVDWALSPSQRQNFLSRWYAINPQQRGALVADVLEQLVDSDSHLDITEPILEAWPNISGIGRALIRPAILALYYIDGKPPMPGTVMDLVVRAAVHNDAPWVVQPLQNPPMGGIELIAKERGNQVLVHGHTAEHDRKEHADGSLAKAAAAYAMASYGSSASLAYYPWNPTPRLVFPDDPEHGDDYERRIQQLAAAGALCAAEIDRMLAEKEGR
jgi:hypothetical protein